MSRENEYLPKTTVNMKDEEGDQERDGWIVLCEGGYEWRVDVSMVGNKDFWR